MNSKFWPFLQGWLEGFHLFRVGDHATFIIGLYDNACFVRRVTCGADHSLVMAMS